MLVVSRFTVAPEETERFVERARAALRALAGNPGYRRGWIGRSVDEPAAWVLSTEWDGTGAYRRALSSFAAKVDAHPLLGEALPGPAAYEVLVADGPDGGLVERASSRAADADSAGPGGQR